MTRIRFEGSSEALRRQNSQPVGSPGRNGVCRCVRRGTRSFFRQSACQLPSEQGKEELMQASKENRLMDVFIADLAKFCRAKHGRVTELAQHLGVAQPHVSAWLTGKQEPSGEHTLRIQVWLSTSKAVAGRARANRGGEPKVTESAEPPVWLL